MYIWGLLLASKVDLLDSGGSPNFRGPVNVVTCWGSVMMKDAATWSAWERKEYCGILLEPSEVAAPLEVMFGWRAWILMGLGYVGPFCRICFRSCRSMRSLMIALTCSRVFLDGSFLMDLVSSIVALWIISAWVIVGVWTMWWLNWTVSSVLSAPVFSDTTL